MEILDWLMGPNPYQVTDVPLSDYKGNGKIQLKQEGRMILYKNTQSQSWDCLLKCPETPTMALRLFQVTAEEDAMNWFPQYALKLQPFIEIHPLKTETVQTIVDCIRSHPDWSSAHIAVDTGLRDGLKQNDVQSQINDQDASGQTPLHLACEQGDLACVKKHLEESQARTDIKDQNGETPMHDTSKQDSPVILQASCSQLSSGVNELNKNGETPLHVACRLGHVKSVNALLKGGAKCDVSDNAGSHIHTAKNKKKGCAEELLRADPGQLKAEDSMHGGTPLNSAKAAKMTRLLLEHGSDVNSLSKTGESALHIATKQGSFEPFMVLLTHGADANLKDQHGNTALHYAMKMNNVEMIKALIVFGADVEVQNNLGETPGHIAERNSNGPNGKTLLDMLSSIGVHRCLPLSPGSPLPPPISNKTKRQDRGLKDIMSIIAQMVTMAKGQRVTDGPKLEERKTDRLLSLDGGGIRGLVLIQVLIALEKETGKPTRELFNWIAGTSTGGILALGLIHGKDLEYLRCLYFRMKKEVFKGSRPYESAPLENFLKKEFGENTKMADVQYPRVMVTSVLADRHPGELHIFRNYDLPDQREPLSATTATSKAFAIPQEQHVWKAARSSGAAPTYFRPMDRFLDGGLLANNPTLDAIKEIHQYNKTLKAKGREQDIKKLGIVVSLGTGKRPSVKAKSMDVVRVFDPLELVKNIIGVKELGKMLVDCCTDSDSCVVDRARAWCEMVDALYYRLTPLLAQEVMLDEVSDAVLVNMLWETQLYLFQERETLQSLAQYLLQN